MRTHHRHPFALRYRRARATHPFTLRYRRACESKGFDTSARTGLVKQHQPTPNPFALRYRRAHARRASIREADPVLSLSKDQPERICEWPAPKVAMSSTTPTRRPVHLRRIECTGFERDDGLFDIEGRLIDTKPTELVLPERTVAPEEAIHHMTMRLTVGRDFVIRDVQAKSVEMPYRVCGDIAPAYRQLIGTRIEAGFTQKVKRLFRGIQGCAHLTELLPVMATTAFQIIWSDVDNFDNTATPNGRTRGSPLGGCHALRLDGEVVMRYFPHLRPPAPTNKD